MSQEEAINIDFDSKGVRLDVYAKDADGLKVYNIELQASDTKELPERSRYYQGVVDVDLLKSGQRYKDLKTSFIIFICVDDIFKNGLPKYKVGDSEKTYERDAGREEKAVENAVTLVRKYNASPESAAADMDAPLDKVLEALAAAPVQAN